MATEQTIDVTVRLDRDVKEKGEAFFKGLGVNFSAAVNALVLQAVQGQIPFDLDDEDDDEPRGNAYTYSAELAEQWAREDPLFSVETYKQDPYFDKEEQAFLRRRAKCMEEGIECGFHELIDTE